MHRKDFDGILDLFKEKYRFSSVSLYRYIEASVRNSFHQKSQCVGTLGLLFLSGLLRVLIFVLLLHLIVYILTHLSVDVNIFIIII